MSLLSDFGVEPPNLEEQARLKEMADSELQYNIQMLEDARLHEPPCETFYRFKKEITLSTFLQVYTFDELVNCKFELPELRELIRLYSILSPSDKMRYADSLRLLQQKIAANKIPGSYGRGFQSWKEQRQANQEVQDVVALPEPSEQEIDAIASQHYLSERISTPPPPPPEQTLGKKFASFFGFGGRGSRKMSKKISRRQKRSKSRSKKLRSKKSRSKSRSKK